MKKILFLIGCLLLLFSCGESSTQKSIYVNNSAELNKAIDEVVAGDEIVLANGVWKDVEINFTGMGTKRQSIILRAETPGHVFIEGLSYLHLGGEYLIVDGLYFRNGHTPKSSIIRYMINDSLVAYNCRVTNSSIVNFTQPSRLTSDRWIEFFGKNNKLDYCYISGKSNDGETIRVFFTGNEHINTHHQISHNYFGPRPRKGGPRGETIRVGDSKTRVTPGYVNVSDNYFEACNGEVEIISDKTNFNTYKNNIFYKCEGSLVLRHGSYATVDSNIFIGGDDSNFYGGIRVVNSGHWIINNYFYKINGEQFRAPLALMNGIPMTPLNRYLQVSDIVVAYNTWVDCKTTWQIGVGQNIESAGVLPINEIRSAPPIRSTIANNIIYNTTTDAVPVVNHSSMDGILFKNNVIDNNGSVYSEYDVLQNGNIQMKKINHWLYAPESLENNILNDVFMGYDFTKIKHDMFGMPRSNNNSIGAITDLAAAEKFKINTKKYGPSWYSPEQKSEASNTVTVLATAGALEQAITKANNGDIIVLSDTLYTLVTPLKINKNITIRSNKLDYKTQLVYMGKPNTPAFEMNSRGILNLENITLKGDMNNNAFQPLQTNMGQAYNLYVKNCIIKDFNYVLKASKGSFADVITITKSVVKNCQNGIVLAAEEKGDYNAEFVTINQCEFENIASNVIHFYRGGYDESTIGGVLKVSNSTFINSGSIEQSGILLKTKGIINIEILNNIFKNNPVDYVAILWGEKNNQEVNNTLINSGLIKVEDQQEFKILY